MHAWVGAEMWGTGEDEPRETGTCCEVQGLNPKGGYRGEKYTPRVVHTMGRTGRGAGCGFRGEETRLQWHTRCTSVNRKR